MQREDCRGGFQKKYSTEVEEIASLDVGARNQYSFINFLGEFIENANVRDFYTVVLVAGKASRVRKVTSVLFLIDH